MERKRFGNTNYIEQLDQIDGPRTLDAAGTGSDGVDASIDWLLSQWLTLGLDCCEAADFEAAINAFEQALQRLPDCEIALHGLAIAFNSMGAHADAIAPLERLLAMDAENGDAWGNYGHALAGLERYSDALAAYRRSLDLAPHAPLSWYNCARILFELGRYDEAAVACDRALELSPEDGTIWFWSGQIARKLDRTERALAAFERSLVLLPDNGRAWNYRGVLLESLGRHQDAIASYGRALELEPDYAEAWNNRGISLEHQGDAIGALTAFQTSLKFDDRNPDAWNNCGLALAGVGRHGEAVTAYDRAILLTHRQYWRAWINRGWSLLACQGLEAAMANWESCAETLSNDHPQRQLVTGLLKYHQGRACGSIAGEASREPLVAVEGWQRAWGYLSESLDILTAAEFPHWRLEVLQEAIAACRSLNDDTGARNLAQSAMDLLRHLVRTTTSTSKKVEYAAKLAGFYQLGNGKIP